MQTCLLQRSWSSLCSLGRGSCRLWYRARRSARWDVEMRRSRWRPSLLRLIRIFNVGATWMTCQNVSTPPDSGQTVVKKLQRESQANLSISVSSVRRGLVLLSMRDRGPTTGIGSSTYLLVTRAHICASEEMSDRCTNLMTSSTGEMARRGGEDGSFITISPTVFYISQSHPGSLLNCKRPSKTVVKGALVPTMRTN